jgi:hypothetical protein
MAVVEYKTKLQKPRRGVCSTWMANLQPDKGRLLTNLPTKLATVINPQNLARDNPLYCSESQIKMNTAVRNAKQTKEKVKGSYFSYANYPLKICKVIG